MKIRTDFVSNSSSSSFVIIGSSFDSNDLSSYIIKNNIIDKINTEEDLDIKTCDELFNEFSLLDILDIHNSDLNDMTTMFDYDSELLYIGMSLNKMSEDETLKTFKTRVADELKNVGLNKCVQDIRIIQGIETDDGVIVDEVY